MFFFLQITNSKKKNVIFQKKLLLNLIWYNILLILLLTINMVQKLLKNYVLLEVGHNHEEFYIY